MTTSSNSSGTDPQDSTGQSSTGGSTDKPIDDLKHKAEELFETVKKNAGPMFNDLKAKLEPIISEIKEKAPQYAQQAKEKAGPYAQQAKEKVQPYAQQLKEKAAPLIEDVTSKIDEVRGKSTPPPAADADPATQADVTDPPGSETPKP